MSIHPTAIVGPKAEIDSTAEIGPYVVIEGSVRVGASTRIHAHACVAGWTRIGARCEVYPHACIGYPPQDLAYDGAETYCNVGDDTVLREFVSIHRGTTPESTTSVGSNCFLMANAHVAHNCCVGDRVILANAVLLAGHVHIGNGAFLGGASGVHQFVRLGELVMLGGMGVVTSDVPPFFMAGERNRCMGVNVIGMRRAGLGVEERTEIRKAHQLLYRSGVPFPEAVEQLATTVQTESGKHLVEFLRSPSKRGIISGRRGRAANMPDDRTGAPEE
jgi:UDP-N-acetylglucosamine acyltransferase